jgi:hypothetical protein
MSFKEDSSVIEEANRIVEEKVLGDLKRLVEAIERTNLDQCDVNELMCNICEANENIAFLTGKEKELYEVNKFRLFQTASGRLQVLRGKEIDTRRGQF